MPTYEYRCQSCGHEFELFQSMTAPVKRKCPKCSKPKLERLIGTGAGIIFKGGGFYQTDYRSENYTKAAEAEKKSVETKTDDTKKTPDKAAASATTDSKAASTPAPTASDASASKRKKKSSR